jgi:sialidase-1
MNSTATIISTKVICKQEGRYIGWPSITKTARGELLAVFSGDRDSHVCPWGKTQMVRSGDNGESWTGPETINNSPLDDRDPGIVETKDGALVLSWFTSLAFDDEKNFPWVADKRKEIWRKHFPWLPDEDKDPWKRHIEKIGPEIRKEWKGNWVRRYTDGGKTWGKPVRTNVSSPHGPIVLDDGRLLYVGRGKKDGEVVIGVEESTDNGKSWQLTSTIPLAEGESMDDYVEPHMVQAQSGKLVAMIRYHEEDMLKWHMRQSESFDGGQTWSIFHPTEIWGYPPHLVRLADSRLLVVYGRRILPYGERGCISTDEGESWDVEHELDLGRAPNGDLGYPASVQLDDGSICTVYYQPEEQGQKPCLMATHWELNNA